MLERKNPLSRPAGAAAVVMGLLLGGVAAADDRQELTPPSPYLFVIFDTSSSMANAPPCSRERSLEDMNPYDGMCTSECPLESDLCKEICPDLGCREYDFSSIPRPAIGDLPAITRDNGGPGTSDLGWTGTTVDVSAEGGNYLFHDQNPIVVAPNPPAGCGELPTGAFEFANCASASFDPNPDITGSGDGDYMIFVKWPVDVDLVGAFDSMGNPIPDGKGDTFASNTLIEIVHDDPDNPGSSITTSITVNQKFEGGRWNPIGTFPIDPAVSSGIVTIRNDNANGIAVADAVGWLKVTIPACVGTQTYRCQQPICNEGDCYTELNGDDPRSKLFQSKQALYDVIDEVAGIRYGFATFEQDEMRMAWKHWRYRVADQAGLPTLGGTDFLTGAEEVFGNGGVPSGDGWNCFTLGPLVDGRVGCFSTIPGDVEVAWDLERARRIPRLGWDGTASTPVYFRKNQSQTYRVTYSPNGGSVNLGDAQIMVDVDVTECPTPACGGATTSGTVVYELVTDYVAVESPTAREPMSSGGFFQSQRNANGDLNLSCRGLENNDERDPMVDIFPPLDNDLFDPSPFPAYSLRWPTTEDANPDRGELFDVGDMLPFDWNAPFRREMRGRMAPNINGGSFEPDFRSAVYFRDSLDGADSSVATERLLRLKNERQRPILPFGDTPLGESLFEFETWFENSTGDGWADIGSDPDDGDQFFGCRRKALMVLTDGAEECWAGPGDPDANGYHRSCPIAARLFDPDEVALSLTPDQEAARVVETFVVGFGVPGATDSDLACMAYNGRTAAQFQTALALPPEDPDLVPWPLRMAEPGKYLYLPENAEALSDAMRDIIGSLALQSQTFASAALPAIQSTAADNIYLSRFFPLVVPARSVWPGRLDAFRRPLPLDMAGAPDLTRLCIDPLGVLPDKQAACYSWEAGAQLCGQSPTDTDLDGGDYKLGLALDTQRRVFYGQEATVARPNPLRLFSVPTVPADPVPPAANPALGNDAQDLVEALDPFELRLYEGNSSTPTELGEFFEDVIGTTLKIKDNPLDPMDPDYPADIGGCDANNDGINEGYVLGDIFHANPVPILNPTNFTYFANNRGAGAVDGPQRYRTFARDNVWRRRMLAAGTNDGQLHFFDIGVRQLVDNNLTPNIPNDTLELFNDGSGHELFSYIPRSVLPVVRYQAGTTDHVFSVDSTVAVADVFIDPVDATGGATASERFWRTVVIGGMREGGTIFLDGDKVRHVKSGYYALDVTQPDILNARTDASDPTKVPCPASHAACDETTTGMPIDYTPSCLGVDVSGAQTASCGLPFPMELWTFNDSVEVTELQVPAADDGMAPNNEVLTFYLDEDANGIPDLADTWSRAVIGQILVCPSGATKCDVSAAGDSSELAAVEVAIFGGGMDPERKGDPEVGGNYLYMVNVETGELIYKRELPCPPDDLTCHVGSAPGDPAVIDQDRDGYFDFVYIGTTEGLLFKVDLTVPASTSMAPAKDVPALGASFDVTTAQLVVPDPLHNHTRFVVEYPGPLDTVTLPGRVTDSAWDPFPIFDTGGTPIYHAPTVFFIPELGDYGLAIGTGDREELRDEEDNEECAGSGVPDLCSRFYVFVDEDLQNVNALYNDALQCGVELPISTACLENIAFTDDPDLSADFLTANAVLTDPNKRPGWVLLLKPETRVLNEAFLVSGITIFTAFEPILTTDCDKEARTQVFVVTTKNAGPVAPIGNETDPSITPTSAPAGERNIDRYQVLDEFITAPFIGNTATKNPNAEGETILDAIDEAVSDSVRDALLDQYPRGSRFNKAFSLLIAALKKSAGVEVFATVPIAVYPSDWKDQ